MSTWSEIVIAVVVLAVVIPLMIMVGRRMMREQPVRDGGIASMPPSTGPGVDIGGGPAAGV